MTIAAIVALLTNYGPIAISAAAAAMAVLPQGKPGSLWDTVRTGVNYLAFNWGNAKNIVQK